MAINSRSQYWLCTVRRLAILGIGAMKRSVTPGDPQLGVSLPAATDGGGLILDVYDAVGAHVTFTKTVTSTGCSGQYLC